MSWEIFDGNVNRGPFTEGAIIAQIRAGLSPTTMVRPVGKGSFRPVGAHPPFAEALAGTFDRLRAQTAYVPQSRIRDQIAGFFGCLLILSAALIAWTWKGSGHVIVTHEGKGVVLSVPPNSGTR